MYSEVGRCPECGTKEITNKAAESDSERWECYNLHCNKCGTEWKEFRPKEGDER